VRATLFTLSLLLVTAAPAAADVIDAGPTNPVSALEGTQFSGTLAEFDLDCTGGGDCPDPATMKATIGWGDADRYGMAGTSVGTISRTFSPDGTTATYTVTGSHTYFGISGTLKLTVAVTIGSDVLQFAGDATVADAPITAYVGSWDIPPAGTVNGIIGRFVDPGGPEAGPGVFAARLRVQLRDEPGLG
jgi:hypothetical protein